ncbi:ABC transporter ATP-binding protein [Sporichthya brevicatena]|uniref:ABC transporter ATP-binding protein n=1 Tax=Sporichthya brevicatena TaxID=171442 RepID=A0ABP3RLU3_9ACTN
MSTPVPTQTAKPARTPSSAVRHALVGACRANPRAAVMTVLWTALASVPAFLHGKVVARALDDGFLAGDRRTGLTWLALLAATALVAAVGAGKAVKSVSGLVEPFRDHLVEFVVAETLQSATAPDGRPDAGAVARLSQQIETVRGTLGMGILGILAFVAGISSSLAGQSTLSTDVLIFVVPPVVLSLAIFGCSLPTVVRRERALILSGEQVAASVTGTMEGLRDIQAAGAAEHIRTGVGDRIDENARLGRAVAAVTAWRLLVVGLGARVPIVLIVLGIPWLLDRGTSPGEIAGSVTYAAAAIAPAMTALTACVSDSIIPLWVTLGRILGAGPTRPAPHPVAPGGTTWRPHPALVEVRLRKVGFAYGPTAEPVLRNLSLTVVPGEHLAVVGPSGIGKSTLVNLICGMLRPGSGTVTVAGTDIGALDPQTRARVRVLIPQEAFVFSGTLGENIRYLRPDATPEMVEWACYAVGLTALRDRLGGLDARVDPATLSAGERQLIALTRAYLSAAPLAVLDEATCHLDPSAEMMAEQAFAARGGTLIVVAHRMSSALRADRILVLDGATAALGTHDELLASSALYRDLVGHWQGSPA